MTGLVAVAAGVLKAVARALSRLAFANLPSHSGLDVAINAQV